MSSTIPSPFLSIFGLQRGRMVSAGGLALGAARLPTDPIGSHTLTLTNVVVDSRILIRDQADTTTLYDQIAATSTVVIPLSVYSSGSQLNDCRIRIRKASAAPFYQPYETLATLYTNASSIYVNQLPDQG